MVECILSRYASYFATVVDRDEDNAIVVDPVHGPLCAVLDTGAPVVAAGLHGVADEDPLLLHTRRDLARVEFASLDATLLDRVVDGIRLRVSRGNQCHSLAARVPVEVRLDHPLTRRVVVIHALEVATF